MEISGVDAIFSEKVAVRVTTPEVTTLSESLLVRVSVAFELQVPHTGLFSFDKGESLEKLVGSEEIFGTHQPLMF